jgi:5-(carboxyamino)imidazole ribonucleotide synthase
MRPLLPGAPGPDGTPAMLGVMGGGQLARMFVHAAQALGFRTAVLDPDPGSPAGLVSHLHLRSAYDDTAALEQMARQCVAVSTEFENVPAPALAWLAQRLPVAPGAQAVAVCQQRAAEKAQFLQCGVPCAPHAVIAADADVAAIDDALFPGILKTAQLGYDGKGQAAVASRAELAAAWQSLKRVPCVLEKRLPLAREISAIVARSVDGQVVHLPVQQNLHLNGILAVTQVPAPDVPPALSAQALEWAARLAAALDYVGVLCVEFFVLADGSLVANEMAPRPHNSGHYSIDACDVSQFELQVRCMAALPLPAPRQHSPAVMLNLLGDLWFSGGAAAPLTSMTPPWERVLALPGAHLHLYAKAEPRRGRKMGHLTVTAADAAEARQVAQQAVRLLGLPAF